MDDILAYIEQKHNFNTHEYTLRLTDPSSSPIELDRTLRFYAVDLKETDFLVSLGRKVYHMQRVNEGDKDVLILQMLQGKPQVMAGTAEKLLNWLIIDGESGICIIIIKSAFRKQ